MASTVSICNLGLANLGDEATVTSIDPPEGSQQAEHCARYYPIALDAILADHKWSFATRRMELVALDVTIPDQWGYAYQYPGSCVKPHAVLAPGSTDDDGEDYVVETTSTGAKVIYTNVEDAVLKYTHRVVDTTQFSPAFVIALARRLSAFLAGPVIKGSEGAKVGRSELELYMKVELPAARADDANARSLSTYNNFVPDSHKARA